LLKAHKRSQAELKMRNRVAYQDLGLVFAKEWGDLHGRQDSLGLPVQSNNLGQREFARILKAAAVRPITIHGLRHTSATLLLKAGVRVPLSADHVHHFTSSQVPSTAWHSSSEMLRFNGGKQPSAVTARFVINP
jgi:integrase